MDTPKHDVSEGKHVFKARPLNKKVLSFPESHSLAYNFSHLIYLFTAVKQILSSRGDMGIFKNSKRETTVPLVW